jgi:hypothetical protein
MMFIRVLLNLATNIVEEIEKKNKVFKTKQKI